jgi:polysaccharide pyruvyl transferase WcaK-like protein
MSPLASLNRRQFLSAGLAATLAASLRATTAAAADGRPPRILLRSSWQTVNIGDIAHTPGVLRLLEDHLPEAEVTLWPGNVGNGVEAMLRRRFPKVRFALDKETVARAFDECDFLLHGSGPSLVGQKQVAEWKAKAGKPYGVYGITIGAMTDELRGLLTAAQFAFFRDTVSLQFAKDNGVTCPVMEFGPDGAFAVDLRNDDAAEKFLKEHDLARGKFLCCIPRLRYTPYWKIHNRKQTDEDVRRFAHSTSLKEHDHAPLRQAIIEVVRNTDLKVLLCPEDQSQMDVAKEMLFDPLPEDIRKRVVHRSTYWLTDEALSTYVRSAGLFGLEMHSPIMCIGNGVPAVVCRFSEQTSKGFMWRDIGLEDWLFDMDKEDEVARIVPTVLGIAKDPALAAARVQAAREFVLQRQKATMGTLRQSLGNG